ncbi:hypothetical protein NUW58_g2205 [Xylaria curta]|nr:hypothetical protein NUW58_g2205 [Xylaria curta]
MEAIGTTAALTELLSLSIEVSKAAKSLVESFVNAPGELIQLATKLTHIQSRIEQLHLLSQELSAANSAVLLPSEHQTLLSAGLRTNFEALQTVQSLCNARLGKSETIGTRWRWAMLDKKKASRILENITKAESDLSVMLVILGVRLSSVNEMSLRALSASHALLHSGLRESTETVKELIHVEIQGLMRSSSANDADTSTASNGDLYQPTHTRNTLCVEVKTVQQNHQDEWGKQSAPMLKALPSTHIKDGADPGMRLVEHDMRRSLSSHSVAYGSLRGLRITDKRAIGALLTVQSKRNRRKLRLVLEIGFKLFSRHVLQFELNLRQTARHWSGMPSFGYSMPIFNVREHDAPIFQACRDRDVNRHVMQGEYKKAWYTHEREKDYYRIQQLVEHLLDQGCDPSAFHGPIRRDRLPAALHAFDRGYSSAVSALLSRGADIASFDSIVARSLQDVNAGFQWKLDVLRSMGYSDWKPDSVAGGVTMSESLLHGACEASNVQEVLFALEAAGLDPNTQSRWLTPLDYAVERDFLQGAAILIECGATIEFRRWGRSEQTYGPIATAHYHLLHGADPRSESLPFCLSPWQRTCDLVDNPRCAHGWSFTNLEGGLAHLLLHGSDPFELIPDPRPNEGPWTGHTWKLHLQAHEIARFWSEGIEWERYSAESYEQWESNLECVTQAITPRFNFRWSRSGLIYQALSEQSRERSVRREAEEARPSLVQGPRCRSSDDTANQFPNDAGQDPANWGEQHWQICRDEIENDQYCLGSFFRYQTQFCHHVASAEGRRRLTHFPMVLALCDALQFAGYRAEMDDDGDIWYEIDDGDRYFDAKEYQDEHGNEDWMVGFCPICQDFERHGLGDVLEVANEAKRELFEYREKIKAARNRF